MVNKNKTTSTGELGFLAENIAARHLKGKGYEILTQNYRKPWGEIDIIAKTKSALVFVEVKANRHQFIGDFNPEIRVDKRKLSQITRTALLYLEHEAGNMDQEWQVDIISVTFDHSRRSAKIKHFKNVTEALF